MKISLKYFAALREAVGTGQEQLELPPEVTTVGQVRELLRARGGVWAEALAPERAVRMAHDQVMCGGDTPIGEGAEVAFFPPVTGG
ncbi:molybdopterin converting factor subunit 1 [Massilia oculi]|jgi:molybdopterin synthase sulfur carrier subunit|uniref:Molybdopterin synthase sulfur carrier subunit n=1 Tax=Massilia oculi TaxID=945844 RepID=A0A2S2DCZ3_9BURK|nr:molybdopterin converting factor subunit 1 [Massilia oculi]AWL03215.1 molybdopterin converting factor subunit 1 [Massilia oculi]